MLQAFRFVKHLLVFLCVVLPLMAVGWVTLLPLCIYLSKDDYKLPFLFRWFDNVDAYIGRDDSVYRAVCAEGWWARYCWLAWRNPLNYFGYMYLGFTFSATGVYYNYDPTQNNVGDTTAPGFRYLEFDNDPKSIFGGLYYEYYWIYRYKWNPSLCFRYRLGWKIGNNQNPVGSRCQWVFVISPFHSYTGA